MYLSYSTKISEYLHGLSLTCLRLATNKLLKMREREISNSAGHQVYSLPTCSKGGWQVNSILQFYLKDETQKLQVKLKKNVTTVNTSIFFSLIVFKLHSFIDNFNQV